MKIGFIYPGQGTQRVGMGQELYESIDECKELINHANDLLDFDLKKVLFEHNDKINETEYSQVCIFVISLCMKKAVELLGFQPDLTAGHSLGEYCSLVTSEILSFEDALKIVRLRGKLMQNTVSPGIGKMVAVIGLENKIVELACKDVQNKYGMIVAVSNYNYPGQIVISGHKEAIEIVEKRLLQAGAKGMIELNVRGAFHTDLYKEAGKLLRDEIDNIEMNEPLIPYISNVNAKIITDKSLVADLLEKQISCPVLWKQSMDTMIENGIDTLIEVGASNTLTKFMKKIEWDGVVKTSEQIIKEFGY